MSAWLVPALLPALIIMALFALIPRRLWFVQLPVVVGWAVVWIDNRLTVSWLDVSGLTMVMASAVVQCPYVVASRGRHRRTGGDGSSW
jgi:hypothetical protein